jgi:hypothetical protein
MYIFTRIAIVKYTGYIKRSMHFTAFYLYQKAYLNNKTNQERINK